MKPNSERKRRPVRGDRTGPAVPEPAAVDPWQLLELLERGDPAARVLLGQAWAHRPPREAETPEIRLVVRLHRLLNPEAPGVHAIERPEAPRAGVEDPGEPRTDIERAIRTVDAALAATRALKSGRLAELVEHTRAAAATTPASMPWIRFYIASLFQACFRFTGDPALHRAAVDACTAVADEIASPHLAVQARALLGNVHLLRGAYHRASDACDAATALAAAAGLAEHPATAMAYQFRGYVRFEWNRLDEAESDLLRAWELAGEANRGVRSGVARMMARLAQAKQRGAEAEAWLERLERIASEPGTLRTREWLAAVRARHTLDSGDLRALEAWLRTYDYRPATLTGLAPLEVASRLHELDHVLSLLEVTGRWAELHDVAQVVLRGSAGRRAWFAARALTADAVALEALGSSGDADARWRAALEAGTLGSFVRLYLEGSPLRERLLDRAVRAEAGAGEATRVQQAAGPWRTAAASTQLTRRQATVLRLVERGCSNKSVARQLGVSVSTVRTHLREVFSRLGASTRTEAVAIARERGWI